MENICNKIIEISSKGAADYLNQPRGSNDLNEILDWRTDAVIKIDIAWIQD